jgi:hypothetical protein
MDSGLKARVLLKSEIISDAQLLHIRSAYLTCDIK